MYAFGLFTCVTCPYVLNVLHVLNLLCVNVLHVLNIFGLFTCVTCPYSGMFVVKLCCLSHAERDGLMSVLVGTVAPFVFELCGFLPCRCDSLRYVNVLSRHLSPLSLFFVPSSFLCFRSG